MVFVMYIRNESKCEYDRLMTACDVLIGEEREEHLNTFVYLFAKDGKHEVLKGEWMLEI